MGVLEGLLGEFYSDEASILKYIQTGELEISDESTDQKIILVDPQGVEKFEILQNGNIYSAGQSIARGSPRREGLDFDAIKTATRVATNPTSESVQTAVWKQYMATSNPDLAAAAAFWKIWKDDPNVSDSPYMLGLGALQTAYALVGRQGLANIVQGLGAGLWHVLATPMRQPQYKPDG